MKELGLIVTPVNPREATDEQIVLTNDFGNRMRAERMPDDPPVPLEEHTAGIRNIPAFVTVRAWIVQAEPGGPLVADAHVGFANFDSNRHVADFGIEVAPELRRRGLAKRLLGLVAEAAREQDKTLLITGTNGRVPAGAAFMKRIGAERGLETHTNQLDLAADLDRDLLRDWQERAKERAADFELGWWDGPLPEKALPVMAAFISAVQNQMPRDDLKLEDMTFTEEHVREMDKGMIARGGERWVLYARERATGAYAGWTELFWHPNRPQILEQGGTGVLPEFRNRGLGRWLKATMLERMLAERPEARFVRTGNADSNAAMLSINNALGFKPYVSQIAWQVETDRVFGYLQGRDVPA
jgi:GNAT superfamily N-acetyltransferase